MCYFQVGKQFHNKNVLLLQKIVDFRFSRFSTCQIAAAELPSDVRNQFYLETTKFSTRQYPGYYYLYTLVGTGTTSST